MSVAGRVVLAVSVLAVAAAGVLFFVLRGGPGSPPIPGCDVAAITSGQAGFSLSPDQAGNAATIAAVGQQLGLPDHAVTVALATAMQESRLSNLSSGDRDSAGLFQQRPSQGWGTYAQVTDPVYASMAFYQHLKAVPGWQALSVTAAAQQVQHSAAPDAYAEWESEARAVAVALTGQAAGALTCHDLTISPPQVGLASVATAEWGTAALSGPHSATRGWAMSNWLVAHAERLGVDKVSFAGKTWTASSGQWAADSAAGQPLSLHQVTKTG